MDYVVTVEVAGAPIEYGVNVGFDAEAEELVIAGYKPRNVGPLLGPAFLPEELEAALVAAVEAA